MEGGPFNNSPQTQQPNARGPENRRQRRNRSGQASFQPYSGQQYSNLNSPLNLVTDQQFPPVNIAVWHNDFAPQQQNTDCGANLTSNQPQVQTNLVATHVRQFPAPSSQEQNLNYTMISNSLALCSNSLLKTSSVAPESSFLPGWQPLQSSSNYTDSLLGGLPQPQKRESNFGWYDEPQQDTGCATNFTSAQQPQKQKPLTYAAVVAGNAPVREPIRPPQGFEHLEQKVLNESQPKEEEAMGQWEDEEFILNPKWGSKVKEDLVVMYEGRDILDLAHNLRF